MIKIDLHYPKTRGTALWWAMEKFNLYLSKNEKFNVRRICEFETYRDSPDFSIIPSFNIEYKENAQESIGNSCIIFLFMLPIYFEYTWRSILQFKKSESYFVNFDEFSHIISDCFPSVIDQRLLSYSPPFLSAGERCGFEDRPIDLIYAVALGRGHRYMSRLLSEFPSLQEKSKRILSRLLEEEIFSGPMAIVDELSISHYEIKKNLIFYMKYFEAIIRTYSYLERWRNLQNIAHIESIIVIDADRIDGIRFHENTVVYKNLDFMKLRRLIAKSKLSLQHSPGGMSNLMSERVTDTMQLGSVPVVPSGFSPQRRDTPGLVFYTKGKIDTELLSSLTRSPDEWTKHQQEAIREADSLDPFYSAKIFEGMINDRLGTASKR